MGKHLERARVLLDQSRPGLAEGELRQTLSAEPDNAEAHALLGLCLAELGRYQEAEREAREAIRLAPNWSFPHYALAYILQDCYRLTAAENAIQEALQLDPDNANYFSLLATIRNNQGNRRTARKAAEQGLAIDSGHVGCLNARAFSLMRPFRKRAALATTDAALARDPEGFRTHYNRGLILAYFRKSKKAMEHFREALRLNPEFKLAEYHLRRVLLAYLVVKVAFWALLMVAVVVGAAVLAVQWVSWVRDYPQVPRLAVVILVGAGAFLPLIVGPLVFLLLRLDRSTRFLLSVDQIIFSNWAGACILLAAVSGAAWVVTGSTPNILAMVFSEAFIYPVWVTLRRPPGRLRTVTATYTGVLAAIGVAAILSVPSGSSTQGDSMSGPLLACFIWGVILSGVLESVLPPIQAE